MSEHIYYTILIALLMTALGFEVAIYLQQLGVIPYSSSQGGGEICSPFFMSAATFKKNKSLTLTLTYCILVGAGAPNPNPNLEPEPAPGNLWPLLWIANPNPNAKQFQFKFKLKPKPEPERARGRALLDNIRTLTLNSFSS